MPVNACCVRTGFRVKRCPDDASLLACILGISISAIRYRPGLSDCILPIVFQTGRGPVVWLPGLLPRDTGLGGGGYPLRTAPIPFELARRITIHYHPTVL